MIESNTISELILPAPRLFVVDISQYFESPQGRRLVSQCGGRIEAVFFFNAAVHVHCCELTPSFEMHLLYLSPTSLPEDEARRDRLSEELLTVEADYDPVEYRHVRSVDLARCRALTAPTTAEWQELLADNADDSDLAREAWLERQLECYRCNHPY